MLRTFFLVTSAALVLLAMSSPATAQSLTCVSGTTASDSACKTFHYHQQIWRMDTRTFTEIYATPQYATIEACEKARNARQAANQQVVDHFKALKKDNVFTPSRFGPCHCDLTFDRSSPNYLDDVRRAQQQRALADALGRQRERLLDLRIESGSPLIRGLFVPPMSSSIFEGRRMVPLPEKPATIAAPTIALKDTTIGSDTGGTAIAVDLPLAAVSGEAATIVAPRPAPPVETAEVSHAEPPGAAAASVAADSEPAEATDEEDLAFVNYETARVQQILAAAMAVTEDGIRSGVNQTCMQRLQLLSNLKAIAEGAGRKSRLASSLRAARDESARIALVTRLFGSSIAPHWAPKDAKDVVVQFSDEIAADPVGVLRDTSGKYSAADRQSALYLVLSRNPSLTSSQDVWISDLIESLLAG